jgi:predicted acetylornithine/succinylornithine family transaminase
MSNKDKLLKYHAQYAMQNYSPYPIIIDKGIGSKLYDTDGKEYLDFLGGIAVNSLGYNHKAVTGAIIKQAKKVLSCSNYFLNEPAILLARELIRETHFKRAFFCNSGTEAMEAAIKTVKKYNNDKQTGAYKFIAFSNSFHGRTIGALSATGQDKYKSPFAPLPDWFDFVPFGDVSALETALKDKSVAALIIECIQGEGGIITPSKEYMTKLSSLVKKYKKALIVDEVQTGVGRTGEFFAYTKYRLKPDIIAMAKGLASGLPIGAILAAGEYADTLKTGDHGTTFGGNPLSAAVGLAVVKIIKNRDFLSKVSEKGNYLDEKLFALQSKYDFIIKEVRGEGLLAGIELKPEFQAKSFNQKFLDNGLILMASGNNTLRFVPPLIVEMSEIELAVDIIDKVFAETANAQKSKS